MKDIGQRMTAIRKELGLTQKEFSQKLNVSMNTIQSYEYGQFPKGEALLVLLKEGFDINWLFAGVGQMRRSRSHPNIELDRMLIWNVAYFICKKTEAMDDAEDFAKLFMDMLDESHRIQNENQEDEEELESQPNVIDLVLHRFKKS